MCAKAFAYTAVWMVVSGALSNFAQIEAAKRGGVEAMLQVLMFICIVGFVIFVAEIYTFYHYSTGFLLRAAGLKIVNMDGHHPWTHPAPCCGAEHCKVACGRSIVSCVFVTLCCSELWASLCDPESRPLSFQLTGLRFAAIDAQFPKAKAKPQQRSGNLPFFIVIFFFAFLFQCMVGFFGQMMLETALKEYESRRW